MSIANISDRVPMLSVPHLFHFICISKQLKNDILLAQPAEEPEDEAPEVLREPRESVNRCVCSDGSIRESSIMVDVEDE